MPLPPVALLAAWFALAGVAAAPAPDAPDPSGAAAADCPAGRVWYEARCLSPAELDTAWTCPAGTTARVLDPGELAVVRSCVAADGTPRRLVAWTRLDPWPIESIELTGPSEGVAVSYHRGSGRAAVRQVLAGDGPGRVEHFDQQGRLTAEVALVGPHEHGLTLHFAPDGRVTKVLCYAEGALRWTDEAAPEAARRRPCPAPPGAASQTAPPRQEPPQVLYAREPPGVDGPARLAVGRADVFFTTTDPGAPGTVLAVPRAGGAVRVIVPAGDDTEPAREIAVDETRVYWSERHTSRILTAPVAGGPAVVLSPDRSVDDLTERVTALLVDATHVWWVVADRPGAPDHGELRRVAKGGGAPETLVPDARAPFALALDETHAWWTEPQAGRIRRVPKAGGGAPVTLVEGRRFLGPIAVDDRFLYWAERGEEGVLGLVAAEGRVLRVPKEGGPPQELATLPGHSWALVAAGTHLFLADVSAGAILRLPKDGGRPTTIARDANTPQSLGVDATHVYFADILLGSVRRVPRDNELPGAFGLP